MMPLVLTFQRCIYARPCPGTCTPTASPVQYSRAAAARVCSGTSPSTWACWPLAVVLFLVALAVFGRLEGNFAEEL